MSKIIYKTLIDKGVSPYEVFMKFLQTQHQYFSKVSDSGAKIYAKKFEETLEKESEQQKIEAENAHH